MQSGQQLWTVDKVSNTFKNCISMMSPDGSIILVRDYDKNSILRAFDMKTGQQQWTVDKVSDFKSRRCGNWHTWSTISPDGSTILVRFSDYDKNSTLSLITHSPCIL